MKINKNKFAKEMMYNDNVKIKYEIKEIPINEYKKVYKLIKHEIYF
jgi:hypothetical protein